VSRARGWQQLAEVGSLGALRAMSWLYRHFGRAFSRTVLYPIAAYFFLRHAFIREASRDYLQTLARATGGERSVGSREVFAHILEFAIQIFDRMVSWGDSFDRIRMEKRGSVALLDLARSGRGGILVGAHFGSFDLLRLVADQSKVTVNVLMYTQHADRINEFFARLDPRSRVRVLPIDPDSVQTAFAVRRCVEAGEFVGILADRVPPGGRGRAERASFLGRPAAFPTAPFELAALLGCPLLFCLCVRTGDAAYEAIAKPLHTGGRVPPGQRAERARELLAAFVAELESACRRAPEQWFNFFDFWPLGDEGDRAEGSPAPAGDPHGKRDHPEVSRG
jgi:predicted LPLAT superfamily acyltransferase